MSTIRVFMAMLWTPNVSEESRRLSSLFATSKKEAVRMAFEKWVQPDMAPGRWIHNYDQHEGSGDWVSHLKELADKGEHEEAINEVFNGNEGEWFEVFEGDLNIGGLMLGDLLKEKA